MASLILTPENQIQRLNGILNRVQSLRELDIAHLTTAPRPKSWSVVEVLEHLNMAYRIYLPKIDDTLSQSPDLNKESEGFKARGWQKFVIEGQRPKNGKRKWKMKTLKRFTPIFDSADLTQEKMDSVFGQFLELHHHLKQSILASRTKDVSKVTFSSAVGSIVRFYLPEAFEFLLCHMERHMVQIDEIFE
ncbi:DinB family protein [Flagellimonas allohymeniacidonis]|uniref:Uncharacterized protein n=1 Tax=Flagellimonas allohymeniacidonis TaxID=2517819 RepID=A0A4Q8QHN9_9FLAO|nr:DinB family protein [Allomuricauda hymeniacidonis]TAI47686.1 hypothetical protein EW142_13570 [Allomuricauda hymeniacidonis]